MRDAAKREKRIARIVAVGVWIIRFFGWTWRIRVKNDAGLRRERQPGRPIIFSLWHGQMLPLLYHHRNEGVSILISEHGDGEIIARIALRLGFRTVRGSTSRGAARALLGMVRVLEEGNDLAITPDGPRGPAKTYAPGPLVVAQRSGRPIIPTVAVASSGWRLKSWDSFLIPRPFARITIGYGEPVFIDAADARAATESADRLREAMIAAEELASV